jgi:hypothetical protein
MNDPNALVTEIRPMRRRWPLRALAYPALIALFLVAGFGLLAILSHYWLTGGAA